MTDNKLCPFCGGNDCIQFSKDGYPEVPKCLIETHNEAELLARWNQRPEENRLQNEVYRLNKYVDHLLCDESRLWLCEKCNTTISANKIEDHVLCPECENPMRPMSVVKDEKIEVLQAEVEELKTELAIERLQND